MQINIAAQQLRIDMQQSRQCPAWHAFISLNGGITNGMIQEARESCTNTPAEHAPSLLQKAIENKQQKRSEARCSGKNSSSYSLQLCSPHHRRYHQAAHSGQSLKYATQQQYVHAQSKDHHTMNEDARSPNNASSTTNSILDMG